jgi:hypothetical protein
LCRAPYAALSHDPFSMWSLTASLLTASLAASPTCSVAVTRLVGLSTDDGLDLAEMLSGAIDRHGGVQSCREMSPRALAATIATATSQASANCGGSAECAAVLGKVGNVDWLVAIQMAKVGPDVVCTANIVRVSDAVQIATADKVVPALRPANAIDAFAADLIAKAASNPAVESPPPSLAAEPPVRPPAETQPFEPPPTDSPRQPEVEQPSQSHAGFYVASGLGAVAVVGAGIGVGFGVSALAQTNSLANKGSDPNYKTYQQNAITTARTADVSYGIAGAFAVAAVVTWLVWGR